MKVCVHQEPSGPALGGSEFVTATLANLLRDGHAVDLVHHRPWLTADRWQAFSGTDLSGVNVRYVPADSQPFGPAGSPFNAGTGHRLKQWMAHLSQGYDLFITGTHGPPPFCHAGRGVAYVLFPFVDRRREWHWCGRSGGPFGRAKDFIRRAAYERWWQQRMAGYDEWWAISEFTRKWTARRWGPECTVVPPPVSLPPPGDRREKRVVMLGRITRAKQPDAAVRAFLNVAGRLPGWELVVIGVLSEKPDDRDYFAELTNLAAGGPVRFCPNLDRAELIETLRSSELFLHAMGYGVDEESDPAALEHFGMATVEAMAAGCVPLVIDRGGQAEIVRHGVDGLLWGTLDELGDHLVRLGGDADGRRRMREQAVPRAAEYSRERFAERIRKLLPGVLAGRPSPAPASEAP